MSLIEFIPVVVYIAFARLILHEIGHWIVLKRRGIKHRFRIWWSWGGPLIGFETDDTDLTIDNLIDVVQVGLGGAFPPLLVLVPLILFNDLFLLSYGLITCLTWAIWTCIEVWVNCKMARAKRKGAH